MQILRLDVLQAHEALNPCGEGVGGAIGVEGDYVSKAGEGHGLILIVFLSFSCVLFDICVTACFAFLFFDSRYFLGGWRAKWISI